MPPKSTVKEQFANQEYPIHIMGKSIELTDAIRSYAIDKLQRIKSFGGRVLDATITIDVQKIVHSVEITVFVNRTKIRVFGESDISVYAAIDMAIAHLQAKLRRYLGKLHDHHGKHLAEIDMDVNVVTAPVPLLVDINDQIEEENFRRIEEELKPHQLVAQEKRALKKLNTEEAIMKMELSQDLFMLYRSEETQKLRVIYRRNDGNYAIMEPE